MKKIATLFALCFALSLQAQYYINSYSAPGMNPGGLNNDDEYPVGSGLDPSWVSIHPSGSSPYWSAAQNIPFAFDFDGAPVTQYKVSNSGVVTFDVSTVVTAPSFTNASIPTAAIPDKSVMVWGIDGTAASDIVVAKTFGTAPNRQHWIFFTSYTFGSNYTYWSIMLEETSNRIFVVDQRHSATITNLTIGIQTNSTTVYAVNGGSNNVSSIAGSNATSSDNAYYEFIPGVQPAYDMGAMSESLPTYLILGQAPFTIGGSFKNFGSQTVNSYDISYSVNNGTPVTANLGSLNVASGASTNGNHPTGWNPSATGVYSIAMWASNINGNADLNNSNDTIHFSATVVDTLTLRKTCMEVYTSSTCVPCVAGNQNMEQNIIPNITNYTVIKYQQDFPGNGDPYANTESVNRRGYYGINSIPRMEIDGQWDGNAASLTIPIFDSYQQEPSFMEIGIQNATVTGTNITVGATIKPLINYVGNSFRYHVVIVEKTTYGNVATNGETQFENVMMNMHPTENGTTVASLTQNNVINVNYTIPMATTNVEQYGDLKVVVFVQDESTKKILQSEWMDVANPASVTQVDNEGEGIIVFPNPAKDQASLRLTLNDNKTITWNLLNTMGQQVRSGEQVNAAAGTSTLGIETADLAEGIYFLNVTAGDKTFTQKVVIKR